MLARLADAAAWRWRVLRGDNPCGLGAVDFIKLDVEGAEELALRGAGRTIPRFRPRMSVASSHTDHEGEKQHPRLVRQLAAFGYRTRELGTRRIYAW